MATSRSIPDGKGSADKLSPAKADAMPTSLLQAGFLTAAMVRRRYKFSNSTLYKWQAEGRFPAPVKIGPRAVRWRAEDLLAFEASLKSANK